MKRMRFVAAPVAAVALAVSGVGVGVANAGPLDAIGNGIGSGMGIGGSIGGVAGQLMGSADGDIALYKDVPGVLLKLIGGSVGLAMGLTPGLELPGMPF
ncbi:hypothetical protein [Tomitella fengzijianii]|uniref:hypothetical protein n=1 Tax=Tomitella fengzijianii TaxID=2597660 RepID=UPI00131AC6E0|nr:hypothetical protein [Tomitella fengzijianii]